MDKKIETAVKALDSKKAFDIEVLDVRELTSLTDYFVIASASSTTQVRALADETEYKMTEAGFEPRQVEGKTTGWILLDYYDTLIHVFLSTEREYYNLEKLWVDAPRVDISSLVTD